MLEIVQSKLQGAIMAGKIFLSVQYRWLLFILSMAVVLCASLAFGVDTVPDTDPLAALMALVINWKTLTPLGIASGVLVVLVQLSKRYLPAWVGSTYVTVIGGVLYGVLQSLIGGLPILQALVLGLITSGGAMAIYDLFKKPLNLILKVPAQA